MENSEIAKSITSPYITRNISHFTESINEVHKYDAEYCKQHPNENDSDEINNHDFTILMDPRSFLEVKDTKHRYSKNLRIYYKEWVNVRSPLLFFDWLDNQNPIVELSECPRTKLDSDVVYYCENEEQRKPYVFEINRDTGLFVHSMDGNLLTTDAKDGWIFVTKNNKIYAHPKLTDSIPRFHHSSFLAGDAVDAAGMFIVTDGQLQKLFLHSGHYRPSEIHLFQLLKYFRDNHVNLDGVDVDAQRVLKVARSQAADGKKAKKKDTPHMRPALEMYYYLSVKKVAWESLLFSDIQKFQGFIPECIVDNDTIQQLQSNVPPQDTSIICSPGEFPRRIASDDILPVTFALFFHHPASHYQIPIQSILSIEIVKQPPTPVKNARRSTMYKAAPKYNEKYPLTPELRDKYYPITSSTVAGQMKQVLSMNDFQGLDKIPELSPPANMSNAITGSILNPSVDLATSKECDFKPLSLVITPDITSDPHDIHDNTDTESHAATDRASENPSINDEDCTNKLTHQIELELEHDNGGNGDVIISPATCNEMAISSF